MGLDLELMELVELSEFHNLDIYSKYEEVILVKDAYISCLDTIIDLENKILVEKCLDKRMEFMDYRKAKRAQLKSIGELLTQYLVNFFNLEKYKFQFILTVRKDVINLYVEKNKTKKREGKHGHYGINFSGEVCDHYIFARKYTVDIRKPEPNRRYRLKDYLNNQPLKSAT